MGHAAQRPSEWDTLPFSAGSLPQKKESYKHAEHHKKMARHDFLVDMMACHLFVSYQTTEISMSLQQFIGPPVTNSLQSILHYIQRCE